MKVGNFSENSLVRGSIRVPATSKIIAPNKDKYAELLQKIIPSLDDILDLEMEHLKSCKTIEDVNVILNKYNLGFNDLHQKQFEVIYDILLKNNENIKSEINEKTKNKDTIIHVFFEELDFLKNNNYNR